MNDYVQNMVKCPMRNMIMLKIFMKNALNGVVKLCIYCIIVGVADVCGLL